MSRFELFLIICGAWTVVAALLSIAGKWLAARRRPRAFLSTGYVEPADGEDRTVDYLKLYIDRSSDDGMVIVELVGMGEVLPGRPEMQWIAAAGDYQGLALWRLWIAVKQIQEGDEGELPYVRYGRERLRYPEDWYPNEKRPS